MDSTFRSIRRIPALALSLGLLGVPVVAQQDGDTTIETQAQTGAAPELVVSARDVTPGKALLGARLADERGQPVGTIEDLLIDQQGRLSVALVRSAPSTPTATDGSIGEHTPPTDGATSEDPRPPRGAPSTDDMGDEDAAEGPLVGVPVAALQFQHPLRGSASEQAPDEPHRTVSGVLSLAERLADAPAVAADGTIDADWIQSVHAHFTCPLPDGLIEALESRDRASEADGTMAQGPVLVACSELIGTTVQNTSSTLGTVADLALDLRDGELLYAIVRSDRLLGLDHELRPLAIDPRQVDLKKNKVHVSVSQAAFEQREPLDEDAWTHERGLADEQG